MNMKKTHLSLAITASLALGGHAFAHEGDTVVNDAYVGDSRGHVVTDSSGDCVRTSSWSEDKMIVGCGAEPAPAPVAEVAPAPAPRVVTERMSLSAGALFDHDKEALKPAGIAELDALAARLKSLTTVQSVEIVGHTDSTGAEDYNQQLSMRRANTVKNYLLDKGVNPSIMTTSGMGESQPVASNATAEGRAQNRRVEITLKGTERSN
ncbi:MAG: OmpA family protein [Gammaproteobacteria bacterium]